MSEASQQGLSHGCEPRKRLTRQGYRCNPVSLAILPKVGSHLINGTFALGYGSDLLPLGNAFSLQAVDSFFEPSASQRKPAAVDAVSAACFPASPDVFAAPTFFRSLLVRLALTRPS